MAQYTETHAHAGGSFFAAVEGIVSRYIHDLRLRREVRRTYKELSALSDRELDDLGISRGEIARISRESVRTY